MIFFCESSFIFSTKIVENTIPYEKRLCETYSSHDITRKPFTTLFPRCFKLHCPLRPHIHQKNLVLPKMHGSLYNL